MSTLRIVRSTPVKVLLPLAALVMSASAQGHLTEAQKFIPVNTGEPGASFGDDVAIWDNTAVVSAPYRGFGSAATDGRVYVYTRTAVGEPWQFLQQLSPTGGTATECFGHSLAIDGDTIVIGTGCPIASDAGAVYVFRLSGDFYQQEQRLTETSSLPQGGDYGFAVDIAGHTIAVGDPLQHGNGRAYVYTRSGATWTRQVTLGPAAGSTGSFGVAVSVFGDQLAVGLRRQNLATGGEVRLFRRSAGVWNFEDSVRPDSVPYGQYVNDEFGTALDLSLNIVLVGAPEDRDPAVPSTASRGGAFIFQHVGGAWHQYSRVNPVQSTPGARFGASVELGGELFAAIGADGRGATQPPALSRGQVLTFRRSGGLWLPMYVIEANDAADNDRLGSSLAVDARGSNWTILSGADGWFGNAGAAYSFEVNNALWTETQKLLEPGHAFDRFGAAVALEGELAVVGAPYENTEFGRDAGAAYVYRRNGGIWERTARLSPTGLAQNDRFGSAVAISGTTIAVSAPNDDHAAGVDAGTVFVFDLVGTSWVTTQLVRANDAAASDLFGTSLALRGASLLAGAPLEDNAAGVNAGAAYLFTRSSGVWSQAAKLASSDLAAGDQLGMSVAIVGSSRVLVGAPEDDPLGSSSGSAYVFDRTLIIGGSIWSQRAKLQPVDGAAGDRFGRALVQDGSYIVVGAPQDDGVGGQDVGSAYIFEISGMAPGTPSTFTQRQKLTDPLPTSGDEFGSALAIDGLNIIVGSPLDDNTRGVDAGLLRLFGQNSAGVWFTSNGTVASDGHVLAHYATSIAMEGNWVLSGAMLDTNDSGANAGALYFNDLWDGADVGSSYCGSIPNATGVGALIAGSGSPYRSTNDLTLRVSRLPLNTTAFFLTSRLPGLVMQPGGSQGTLCLSGAIGRFVAPGQVLNSGANGAVQLTVDLSALPQPSGSIPGQVGETWQFQAWYRDSLGGVATSNFSDGLAVVLH